MKSVYIVATFDDESRQPSPIGAYVNFKDAMSAVKEEYTSLCKDYYGEVFPGGLREIEEFGQDDIPYSTWYCVVGEVMFIMKLPLTE